uniref:Uncharacterized protein n=1 Tax=Lepeophtheirus salmonis TaxID=72036 RepID=A0A0K2TXD7_LEPSM
MRDGRRSGITSSGIKWLEDAHRAKFISIKKKEILELKYYSKKYGDGINQ